MTGQNSSTLPTAARAAEKQTGRCHLWPHPACGPERLWPATEISSPASCRRVVPVATPEPKQRREVHRMRARILRDDGASAVCSDQSVARNVNTTNVVRAAKLGTTPPAHRPRSGPNYRC
jgi:hypothetical protein